MPGAVMLGLLGAQEAMGGEILEFWPLWRITDDPWELSSAQDRALASSNMASFMFLWSLLRSGGETN